MTSSNGNDVGETMFSVMVLNRSVEAVVFGAPYEIPLAYADGMVGAIPVFATRETAEAFSAGRYSVAEIAIWPPVE